MLTIEDIDQSRSWGGHLLMAGRYRGECGGLYGRPRVFRLALSPQRFALHRHDVLELRAAVVCSRRYERASGVWRGRACSASRPAREKPSKTSEPRMLAAPLAVRSLR